MHGISTLDNKGKYNLESTDSVYRLRYTIIATGGSSGNVTLPDIQGRSTIQYASRVSIAGSATSRAASHDVARTGTTISWSPRAITVGCPASHDSVIYVFLK